MREKANIDAPFKDSFWDLLRITFEEASAGSATASILVTENHLSVAGILHGGAAFALADATAGAAMESALDNQRSTALEANVSFLSMGEKGDIVIANAESPTKAEKPGR